LLRQSYAWLQKHSFKVGFGYYLWMVNAVYAIDDFRDDTLLWRIEWLWALVTTRAFRATRNLTFGLVQLPVGETNPLSARSRSYQTKRTVRGIKRPSLSHAGYPEAEEAAISSAKCWSGTKSVVFPSAIHVNPNRRLYYSGAKVAPATAVTVPEMLGI
jgi:hypothetical protein